MRAMLMAEPGGPEVLQPADVSKPGPLGEQEILVRVKAIGVNPIDTKLRGRGTFYPDKMPAILGCDGAGVVEAAGSEVTRFRLGDEVYFCNGGIGAAPGTYAEYTVMNEQVAAAKPVSLDFMQAAAAPLVLITAWESLHDRAQIMAGQDILIHAGAGGVGHMAIQLAKAAGCRVITTVGSAEKAEFARQMGADETVLYKEQDFARAVLDWSDGEGVDVALDAVGGAIFEQTFGAVRPYGKVVTLLQPGPDTDWKQARLRNLQISLELMLSPMYMGWEDALRHQGWILEQCAQLFDREELAVHVSHKLPLEQAPEAHRLIETGGMIGKVVLTVD
ncbi:zinc-dependent alcohol dehydrogenase family protein [Thiohalomonas denitrificans]|uniref:zinc-dependent alcohol dehydrogenase family protein n=1 Tax=Thiohalomonas denitrificans TaxID=415747 RepID=UPI0026F0D794|nr:zinc-dependent alcohol dehydrogenase family protein [Thiohalomonas denitrificans]